MKITKLLILTFAISLNSVFAQQNKVNDNIHTVDKSYLELPKIEVIPITDTKADRQYELYIKLPEGYSENKDIKYPVLYYTDAMWHVEILSGSADFLIKNAILVGISWEKDLKGELGALGAHASRFRDYSIRPSSNPENQAKYQLGQASNHLDFIRNDVIKYIENNYRTDPEKRAYFGYSMGGKFGAYILLTEPSTFKNYILGSPSFSGGRDVPILSEHGANEALNAKGLNANVFISYGDLERESSPYTDEIIAMLKNKNDERLSLKHLVIEGNHETAFPMTAVRSMQWLSQMNNFPVQGGPYFGQKPPGLTPELFAPGIVSINGRNEAGISFSPDLDEVYFTANKKEEETAIYFSKFKGNKWTPVKRANFTNGGKNEELYPFVSLNDKRIYFTAFDSIFSDEKIWYVNRLADSWSDAIQLDSPINNDLVFYINQAKNGDLFYTSISKGKMYYAPNKNGEFPEVQEVELEFGHHGFISPSQEYLLIYTRNKENEKRKDHDIYVCFKEKDGTWTKPINLGNEVNSNFNEGCPSITPDGKYLFFGRDQEDGTGNIYWVSTEVIENLRPK